VKHLELFFSSTYRRLNKSASKFETKSMATTAFQFQKARRTQKIHEIRKYSVSKCFVTPGTLCICDPGMVENGEEKMTRLGTDLV
jgi:hypothetical protein